MKIIYIITALFLAIITPLHSQTLNILDGAGYTPDPDNPDPYPPDNPIPDTSLSVEQMEALDRAGYLRGDHTMMELWSLYPQSTCERDEDCGVGQFCRVVETVSGRTNPWFQRYSSPWPDPFPLEVIPIRQCVRMDGPLR